MKILKRNSRGGHDTLCIGLIAVSEGEEAGPAWVLRHLPCHTLVAVPAPSHLIHKEENLIQTSDIFQVELFDILECS